MIHLMDTEFKTYWRRLDPEGKDRLASELGTSRAYLSQIAHGHRKPSAAMAHKIAGACGAVTVRDLRPDFFDSGAIA